MDIILEDSICHVIIWPPPSFSVYSIFCSHDLLRPSLFIGSHQGQIYALDSFVEEEYLKLEVYACVCLHCDALVLLHNYY